MLSSFTDEQRAHIADIAARDATITQLRAELERVKGVLQRATRGVVTECCGHNHLAHDYQTEPDPLGQFEDREVIVILADELRSVVDGADGGEG